MTDLKSSPRDHIDPKYKWNLEDLYPTKSEWEAKKQEISKDIAKISGFHGTLSASAENFYRILQFIDETDKEFTRLYVYTSMLSDEDTRKSGPLSMKQQLTQLHTELSSALSFLRPEILNLGEKKVDQYYKEYPQLEIYRHSIDDIFRRKEHMLSANEEKIIALAGLMSDTAHESFNILSNADLPYPEITLTDGQTVRIDMTNYSLYRADRNRENRILVFDAFFDVLEKFKRTFGTQLYGDIKKNLFYKNVRKYGSCLESALDRNNIPMSVYLNLIQNINRHLPTLFRYLRLRKRMLNLDKLYFYDVYAPLVDDIDLEYEYEQAQQVIRNSLEPLGSEYLDALNRAFKENWIDVYPSAGKRSGAYMQGSAYDVHPYILMNYKNKYDDLSTLTHELGHAMHSYFSNKYQPYVNAHYPIFLAEVASTVNESLLVRHLLEKIKDPRIRLSLLGHYLEGFRGTLFRQTQFAEYELKIHEHVEQGDSLTGDQFSDIYLDLFRKYYGQEEGITEVDDKFGVEWAFIPHFYYNFYVFQYSTSFTASQTIVARLFEDRENMTKKYLEFLASGSSEYAIPTLKKVGVDMTSGDVFDLTMRRMNSIMDELETILDDNE